jgi:hypothetical protein
MNRLIQIIKSIFTSRIFGTKAFKHSILIASLLGLAFIVHSFALWKAITIMGTLEKDLFPASDSILINNFSKYDASWDQSQSTITRQQVSRIGEQLQEIQNRIHFHFDAVKIFYRNEFSFVILSTLFGILAAVGLFYSLYVGIKYINEYWKTAFITTFAIFSLFFYFLSVFNVDQNIRDNNSFLEYYISLKNVVLSYKTTNQTFKYSDNIKADMQQFGFASASFEADSIPVSPDRMIHYIDLNLAKNINISVAINIKGVPSPKDVYQNLQNMGNK